MLNLIKTKKDYETALARIYELTQMNLKAGSGLSNELEGLSILVKGLSNELEGLSILVKAYEEKHYSIPSSHLIEAIKFRLEQLGVDEKELNKILEDEAANRKY